MSLGQPVIFDMLNYQFLLTFLLVYIYKRGYNFQKGIFSFAQLPYFPFYPLFSFALSLIQFPYVSFSDVFLSFL